MSLKDQILLEQIYQNILVEQQCLLEEGKILDYIQSMGSKLKNAWNVVNTKISTNPKLYKTLMVAGPILAALAAKNFEHLNMPSHLVTNLLDTLNTVDPNISTQDLTDMLSKWDQDHASSLSNPNGTFTSNTINLNNDHDNQYSFSGSHVNTNEPMLQPGETGKEAYVQSATQTLQSLTKGSDLANVIKDFTCETIKSANTDGSGGTVVVEYSGVVTASSREEAMKIMSELVKSAINKSGIDIHTLTIQSPQATLAPSVESLYCFNTAQYLPEAAAFDQLKNTAKHIIVGAQSLAARIKASFKKQPNVPEQQYQVRLQVVVP